MSNHLSDQRKIEIGSFYTPKNLVDLTYQLIHKNKLEFDFIVDTSVGYGDFIHKQYFHKFIGIDIDHEAIKICKQKYPQTYLLKRTNSLNNLKRQNIGLKAKDKILIIGNPPYNNRQSFFRIGKKGECVIDPDIKSNDLGISFLRSYAKLNAAFVCVLHPLSYLIKASNFRALKEFRDQYLLIDGIVVSSKEFTSTSKTTNFPILIGIYQRKNLSGGGGYVLWIY